MPLTSAKHHPSDCPLLGNPAVFGDGNPESQLMFIGQNPGRVEVDRGKPFVGPAGIRLQRLLSDLGLDRDDVWITNVCKCWTKGNAVPPAEAVKHCRVFLRPEILGKKFIVVFGKTAQAAIAELRRDEPGLFDKDAVIFHCIHPAAAIRKGLHEAILRRDTKNLREKLAEWEKRNGQTSRKS